MRSERDSLGRLGVPSEAYYGAFTQRAINNFPVSKLRLQMEFIVSYAMIKKSAAIANMHIGSLDRKKGNAIAKACDEVIHANPKGKLWNQFPVDVFQAGAGTSTNMNMNEVIANRALELLGHRKGSYDIINPNDHVNMSQSTNDTFHDAIHVASYYMVMEKLLPALREYRKAIKSKSKEFSNLTKSGRTHLTDAVPITFGQELDGYSIGSQIKRLEDSLESVRVLSLGGTAVGTGLNTYPKFASLALKELNKESGYKFQIVKNRFAYMQNLTGEAEISGNLKTLALKFIKVANDIRLLASGPNTGLAEISIPEVQAGSSIMPGKVNPSIPEMLDMVCFKVVGNDLTIAMAAQAGQLELNVFGPVVAYSLLESIALLANGINIFTRRCTNGIRPNRTVMAYNFEHSASIATVLSPILGYVETARLVRESERRNIRIRDLIIEKGILTKRELEIVFNPSNVTKPNLPLNLKRKRI
jgi:fumarate hydratase class II